MTERESYQERVTQLLERIDTYSRKRLRLETAGARRPLLAPVDEKLELLRAKLGELVESRGSTVAPVQGSNLQNVTATGFLAQSR